MHRVSQQGDWEGTASPPMERSKGHWQPTYEAQTPAAAIHQSGPTPAGGPCELGIMAVTPCYWALMDGCFARLQVYDEHTMEP